MFPDGACYRRGCVALGSFVVPLSNTKETGGWAIAASPFVFVVTWAVEMVE